jgi:hypothetical protein
MLSPKEFQELYMSVYEGKMDADDRKEMRRLAAQERAAGKSDRMDSKVASKYASSEAQSAARADKKSKGKHIHGMADSYEMEGDIVDEGMTMKDFKQQRSRQKQKEKRAADKIAPGRRAGIHADKASPERAARHRANVDPDFEGNDERNYPGGKLKNPKKIRKAKAVGELTKEAKDNSYLETDMKKRMKNNEKAIEDMKKTKAHADMVKAARKHFEEVELTERELDPTEKSEKERLVKGLKKSAADFKKRYGTRAKSVMYATATKMAKDNMDTSKSDRRYGVEG